MFALIFAAASLLQPSGLPGCGDYPRPHCAMPDIPALEWKTSDRRYVWPVEDNDPPFSRITHHAKPEIYGHPPTPWSQRYCVIDEAANSVDCWTVWEIQAVAYCTKHRWLWIGYGEWLPGAGFALRYEHPELYFEHRSPMRVRLWEFASKPQWPLVVGRTPADVTVEVDRVQVARAGPSWIFWWPVVYLIREQSDTVFEDSFSWVANSGGLQYDGNAARLPASDSDPAACQAVYAFNTNYCDHNPNRPECPR